jgi:hypothetical protein
VKIPAKENEPGQIVIELPDDICDRLQPQPVNIPQPILELITADHYRQGHIGAAEVLQMLNISSRGETSIALHRTS